MKIGTMAVAGLLALGVLALIGVIAANPFSTQASTSDTPDTQPTQERLGADVAGPERVTQPDRLGDMQVSDADSETKPYIGITVVRTDDGPVEVNYVLKGGPSDGLLEAGDLITDVDGVEVTGISDLTDAIAAAGSGATISLTVDRAGTVHVIDVAIGEYDVDEYPGKHVFTSKKTYAFPGFGYAPKLGAMGGMMDGFVRAEIVTEKDDGSFVTLRAVVGTVSNIDASAGSFTLNPKDGSAAIDYTISDDTAVDMSRNGDLGPLNAQDDTLVVDIDGEPKLVQQGDMTAPFGKRFGGKGSCIFMDPHHGHMGGPFGKRFGAGSWPGFGDGWEISKELEAILGKAEELEKH